MTCSIANISSKFARTQYVFTDETESEVCMEQKTADLVTCSYGCKQLLVPGLTSTSRLHGH